MNDFYVNWYRLINKYNQKAQKPKSYGSNDVLYVAEVHMIDTIGRYEEINTTRLAELLGITKGAVSQTTSKLCKKNLIEKQPSKERKNEVQIRLTSTGKSVYDYHRKLHKDMQECITETIDSMSPEAVKGLKEIFTIIEQSLDEM